MSKEKSTTTAPAEDKRPPLEDILTRIAQISKKGTNPEVINRIGKLREPTIKETLDTLFERLECCLENVKDDEASSFSWAWEFRATLKAIQLVLPVAQPS